MSNSYHDLRTASQRYALCSAAQGLPDGEILWALGGIDYGWVNPSGIAFGIIGEPVVAFGSAWSNYRRGYSRRGGEPRTRPLPRERHADMLKTSNGSPDSLKHLATLPSDYHPTGQVAFNLTNHDNTARVDVHPDGRVTWMAGGAAYPWMSLSRSGFAAEEQ